MMLASYLRNYGKRALMLVAAVFLSGCGLSTQNSPVRDESPGFSPRVVDLGEPVPKGGGVIKVGNPYTIAGKTYVPRHQPGYDETGIASWYGVMFHGRKTANGEVYDMDALTAAHPTLPLPVYARVTNLRNQRSVVVRINDRGPYKKDRLIDVSQRAAELLDFKHLGTAHVRVQYLGPAPLNGDDRYERSILASQPWTGQIVSANDRDMSPVRGAQRLVQNAAFRPLHREKRMLPLGQPWSLERGSAHPVHAAPLRQPGPARGFYVQAGLFRDESNAGALRQRLAHIGPAQITALTAPAGPLRSVSIGPYADQAQAMDALAKTRQAGIADARLISK